MDRNANAAETLDVDKELEHVREYIYGSRFLMMDPAVDNSWIGKLLTARMNIKEMTARLRVSYTIHRFAVEACSASLIVTLNSLTKTCHDSHKPAALLLL